VSTDETGPVEDEDVVDLKALATEADVATDFCSPVEKSSSSIID